MKLSLLTLASSMWGLAYGLGQQQVIAFQQSPGSLQLAGGKSAATIFLDQNDWPGVIRAAKDLAADFGRVTGKNLTTTTLSSKQKPSGQGSVIIAGSIGNSSLIDSLVSAGKINVAKTKGQWEAFQTEIVDKPFPGVNQALVIAGSDKRGTIYGLYDISEQIGVSPWYWFADVAPAQHTEIFAINKPKTQASPSVKYRGLFINDEAPGLTNWINNNYPPGKYGPGYTSGFYNHVFELILRLRGNYLWPAEWSNIFYLDDPLNPIDADNYGVVVGTSHTEPLMRWTMEQSLFLDGVWSWSTNQANVTAFMKAGAERSKNHESLYTMGMRGLGDTASPTLDASSLEQIITVQQQLLREVFDTSDISNIPQMWCLYKEVGGYYQQGLQVPDDITLLWADDNWGNIQRLPVGNETDRAAGAGVYYHFDYVGSPQDYKWINTINLQKSWEQLHLAYERSAKTIWLGNVGDLKALEIPLNHFFDLAYDTPLWSDPASTSAWLQAWATREFGSSVADKVADIMMRYSTYAGRRKFDLLTPTVFSLINYNEASTVVSDWEKLEKDAQAVYNSLSKTAQPGFFELVLQPVSAGYTVTNIHVTAALNNLYASQRRTSANLLATQALQLFQQDHALTLQYHNLLNGKWNHILDQTHLGYNYWQQPMRNTIPPLAYVQQLEMGLAGPMGVSVEASNASVPGDDVWHALSSNTLTLPSMDPYGPASRWIDVYSRGTEDFEYLISANASWVKATPSSGTVAGDGSSDVRVYLTIDWSQVPEGQNWVNINVSIPTGKYPPSGAYGNYGMPNVILPVNKTSVPSDFHGFVESDGTVSIEPEHATRNTSTSEAHYVVIPGYGRTLSGVMLTPVTAGTQTPESSPRLEYDLYLFSPASNGSSVDVTVVLGPSLNTDPSRPLTYAVSFDDDQPQMVQFVPSEPLGTLPVAWSNTVSNNMWSNTTTHTVVGSSQPNTGSKHTLNLWAIEPGVVFQKVVVNLGGLRDSYLFPPESTIV